jgi:hypothetical protein
MKGIKEQLKELVSQYLIEPVQDYRKRHRSKEPERIVCSANWYHDIVLEVDLPAVIHGNSARVNDRAGAHRAYRPVNVDHGMVFCGLRHGNCLYAMCAFTGLRQAQAGKETQGFITTKNRFVDREEAARIALSSGQIKKLSYSKKSLYSEDLY